MSALFLPEVDPHAFFEKEASIAKMPDDETKWPAHVLSNLHQQLPFLSQFQVNIDLQRMEPEAGFAFGHALLLSKSDPAAATESKNPENMLRIPIIISDRQLQPFHVFEVSGTAYPLTAERVQAALTSPAIFDGPAKRPSGQKSLIDQLSPPYQHRQGFGLHKSAAAPDYANMSADQLAQLAELKRTDKMDKYQRGLSNKEKVEGVVRQSTIPLGVGAALGAGRAMKGSKAKWNKAGLAQRAGEGLGGALKGALTGGAITGVNQAVQGYQRRKRDQARKKMGLMDKESMASLTEIESFYGFSPNGYKGLLRTGKLPTKKNLRASVQSPIKVGSVALSFSSSNRVPGSSVVGNSRLPLKGGATVASLAFYRVPGTKFVMAVPRSMAKKLEKVTDQQKIRQMISGGMREEIRAARSNLPSPGLFLVFEKTKKGYRYLKPSPIAGMR